VLNNFISSIAQRGLSMLLTVTIAVTSSLPARAADTPIPTCTGWSARNGSDIACGARTVAGVDIPFPKLAWDKISDMPLAASLSNADNAILGGPEAQALANSTALALGLSSKDIASAASVFPSNVPYVFGRYNPIDSTLKIDLFKVVKTVENGQVKAGLYHAVFAPAHGDYWKASRAYLDPTTFKAGMSPGVNPFSTFAGADSAFHSISLAGAQVAVGHAMRLAGAPLSLLAVADVRMDTRKKKSGNALRKKTEVWVYGYAKSKWYIGQPKDVLSQSTTLSTAAFCAQNPTATDCPLYGTAVSGVAFEEFEGGVLDSTENQWTLDYQKSSGFTFIGALLIAVVASFAIVAAAGALGVAGATAGAAGSGAGVASSMGTFGQFLVTSGYISANAGLATMVGVEAAYVGTTMAILGGANLSSTIATKPGVLLGRVTVQEGRQEPGSLSTYQSKLNGFVAPLTTNTFPGIGSDASLASFSKTITGDCGLTSTSAACGVTGVISRKDDYVETQTLNLIRDNNGVVIRDTSNPGN
jgi:hypothetical protein